MKRLFINLKDKDAVVPPPAVEEALFRSFDKAVNVEWFQENGIYETIFYHDSKEYIALFEADGQLIDFRINLSPEEMPTAIAKAIRANMEVMNVVQINKAKEILYEVIFRNKELIRYVILVTATGDVLEEKAL